MDRLDEKVLEAYEGVVGKQVLNEGKLTKKDFNELASIMKSAGTLDQLKSNIVGWANKQNPMFNAEQFKKAAGVNESKEIVDKEE